MNRVTLMINCAGGLQYRIIAFRPPADIVRYLTS
jgi:hypothetical protein